MLDRAAWIAQEGPQTALITCPTFEVFFGGARGGGKALRHGEPVLTPWGQKPIEACAVGDQVLNPDGTTARIIGVYPQGRQPIYRVTVDDGAYVDVTADHLWMARLTERALKAPRIYLHSGEPVRWRIWTTRQLAEKKDCGIRLPLTMAVAGQAASRYEVATDPYVIGLMIGDGCLVNSLRFTSADAEIQAIALAVGFKQSGRPIEFFARQDTQLAADLKRLGLYGKRSWEKFIPHRYMHAEAETRLAVLQGLLDTDGYADERGHIEYCSTSRQLADDVQELVRGMGGKATLSEKLTTEHRPAYRVHIRHAEPANFFRLMRKKKRCEGKGWNGGWEHTRKIVSIEPIGEDEATCIKVDHPNGLFLTRGHIVTHNTDGMLGDFIRHAARHGEHAIGIMFRRDLVQLIETIERSHAIYRPLGCLYNGEKKLWRFPNGARLRFAYLERDQDAEGYQGHSYTRVYVEEIGNFPREAPILKLMATLRSGFGVPVGFRATGNPGGPGHQWVKRRYIDPAPGGWKVITDPLTGLQRIYIPSRVSDNSYLGADYVQRLQASGSAELVRAWLEGDWSAIEGAFFNEWSTKNVIAPFTIPDDWIRFRSGDWGSASPFSIGWWAVVQDDHDTDGGGALPRGALVRYREWYGAEDPARGAKGLKLTAEQVGDGIARRERDDPKLKYGVMDKSAFAQDGGPSIMERLNGRLIDAGLAPFRPADNSRVTAVGNKDRRGPMGGWDMMRARIKGTKGRPMAYWFNTCVASIRTIPVLQHDPDRAEDLDTNSEDHAADDARYACLSRPWLRYVMPPDPDREAYRRHIDDMADVSSSVKLL